MASPLSVCFRLAGRRSLTASATINGAASINGAALNGAASINGVFPLGAAASIRDFSTSQAGFFSAWSLIKLPERKRKAAITYGGRYTVTLIPGDGIGLCACACMAVCLHVHVCVCDCVHVRARVCLCV